MRVVFEMYVNLKTGDDAEVKRLLDGLDSQMIVSVFDVPTSGHIVEAASQFLSEHYRCPQEALVLRRISGHGGYCSVDFNIPKKYVMAEIEERVRKSAEDTRSRLSAARDINVLCKYTNGVWVREFSPDQKVNWGSAQEGDRMLVKRLSPSERNNKYWNVIGRPICVSKV